MYPNLYFFFKKVFDVEINWLRPVNTFGFFVALSFLIAMRILFLELKRKEKEGYFNFEVKKEEIGKPASVIQILSQFLLGFILGYKLLGLFMDSSFTNFNPQTYLFSTQGNALGGLILGFVFSFFTWYDNYKKKLSKPKIVVHHIYPKDRINDFLMLAFIFGFIGAKIFHNLENWDTFIKNPIDELLSFGGLTFYGGLIFATIAIITYLKISKISILPVADAFATTMMIAYAVGRLGCQFSGDGDWGILNSAYMSNIDGKVVKASEQEFQQSLINNKDYYSFKFQDTNIRHHTRFEGNVLPTWLIAQNYPNNVISEGFREPECEGNYCYYLPIAVFPTPLYESVLGFLIFVILWNIRKKLKYMGQLAAIYLILSGLERFLIEKIRVNTILHIGSLSFTQAELISTCLIFSGMILFLKVRRPELRVKKTS